MFSLRISVPAAEMSAPESGIVSTSAVLFSDAMWRWIVGAGSMISLTCGTAWIALADSGVVKLCRGVSCVCLDLQTFAKCPTHLHRWHVKL